MFVAHVSCARGCEYLSSFYSLAARVRTSGNERSTPVSLRTLMSAAHIRTDLASPYPCRRITTGILTTLSTYRLWLTGLSVRNADIKTACDENGSH